MDNQSTPSPNDARADRALAALRTASVGESDIKTATARMLADLRHLCSRHRITIGAVTQQAADTYRREVDEHGPTRYAPEEPATIEPEPVDVVTLSLRGTGHHRSSALEICAEFLDEADILVPLWDLLVQALLDGKASEDPGDIPCRTFHVDAAQRPALARQLLALRREVASEGAIDPARLGEPDGGLEQLLD